MTEKDTVHTLGLSQLEQRAVIVYEGKPLFCGKPPGNGIEIPDDYLTAMITEAQNMLQQVIGAKTALIEVTVKITPYCEVLSDALDKLNP